ncbi:umecyanin-like [Vigna radiata var. radiata]|uniref:Umecyanin-like n=1 Tax=Vigna radiata var. radiata TaxID=3916 RepID=A0A1S3VD55_VIGRR|nr:umecyanin-like [Vigna radiata var. radiata]
MFVQYSEAQRVFNVGDGTGWTTPQDSSTYQSWVSDNTFAVGDILHFDFQTAQHNVVEVPEQSYTSCTSANPIRTYTTGPVNVTLNTAGQHYYICSIGQHCTRGQRLAVNVSGSGLPPSAAVSPGANTTPPPPPSSPAATFSPASVAFFLFLSSFIVVLFGHHA